MNIPTNLTHKYIGIAGQKQNGKDVLCQMLLQGLSGWKRRSWADALKELVCDLFKVDLKFIEEWKENPEPPPGFLMPMRKILQFLGDGVRQIQVDYWIDRMFSDVQQNLVIADTRYINELIATKKHGGINLLIYRPGFLNFIDHPSEALIRPIVEWCLDMGFEGDLSKIWQNVSFPAANVHLIDYFILNNGTPADMNYKVVTDVLPFIQERLFNVAA
jgi:hypothetical protein